MGTTEESRGSHPRGGGRVTGTAWGTRNPRRGSLAGGSAEIIMEDNSDNQTIVLRAKDGVSDTGGEILLRGGSTNGVTVELDGNWGGSERGRIRTHELEIEGGADIAENFDLKISDQNIYRAGMLVSIDPKDPGKLHLTREAYDPKVAGVISGANGVRPGLFIGQKNSFADGDFPIALVGRVYMLADASFGAIKPGDLLTSSPVQGYAMKVRRYKRARGAIVGKSMTRLDEGQGYVLALVNLQ